MEPEDAEWSLNDSLEKLGTSYVDCFLIHWPFACERDEDRNVKLGPDGKVRSSNPPSRNCHLQLCIVHHQERTY